MLKNNQDSLNITENFVSNNFFNQQIINGNNNTANHELQPNLTASPSSLSASSTTSISSSNDDLQQFSLINDKNLNLKTKLNNSSHLFCIQSTKFELPISQPQPKELNMDFLCEIISRLLFLSIQWIKNVYCLAEK